MGENMHRIFIVIILSILIAYLFAGCNKTEIYTVTFDSMGGTVIDSQTVNQNETVSKPNEPQKEGFTFVEWQLNNSTYDFSLPVTQNLILTAFYTINAGVETVTVAYNADNDSGISTVKIAKGCSTTEPPLPIKSGYKFIGWFLNDSKFDFSTVIDENILLIAKWEADKNSANESKINSNNGQKNNSNGNKTNSNNNSRGTSDTNTSTGLTTAVQKHTINFEDVKGIWYVEGHDDDATLSFSINGSWVHLESKGFDYYTGLLEVNAGRGGGEYFYDNGKFYSEEIILETKNKLVYTKNSKTIILYRQKNYPFEKLWPYEQLLKDIDGYYWYLDGYKYAYLHPTVIPWYDHKCLWWESENIQIYNNTLIAYENYSFAEWNKINSSAESNTHNTLLVNPIEFADSLIKDYGMNVKNNKLYMTVGGKNYTFTRSNAKKTIKITLSATIDAFTKTVGDSFEIEVTASPFWGNYDVSATSSNSSIVRVDFGSTSSNTNGNIRTTFYAEGAGNATITFKDNKSGSTVSMAITVLPRKVTGVSLNKNSVELYKGGTDTLVATVNPTNASDKSVTWSSSDDSIVTVSSNGKITAKKHGTTTITVTTKDGGHTAKCTVVVKQKPLKISASIGITTKYTLNSIQNGVSVTAKATDGSENYVAYSIKLYRNGTYVGEVFDKEMFVTPFMNGTYTAEVYVKDSSGNEATSTQTTTISVS